MNAFIIYAFKRILKQKILKKDTFFFLHLEGEGDLTFLYK